MKWKKYWAKIAVAALKVMVLTIVYSLVGGILIGVVGAMDLPRMAIETIQYVIDGLVTVGCLITAIIGCIRLGDELD